MWGVLQNTMESDPALTGRVRRAHENLFSLNIGVAIGLALTFYLTSRIETGAFLSRSSVVHRADLYTRTINGINRFMVHRIYGLKSNMYINPPTGGREVVLTFMSVAFSLAIWVLVHFALRGWARSVVLKCVGGITALAAVSAVWLLRPAYGTLETYPTWRPEDWQIFALEVAVIVGVLYLTRAWSVATWCAVLLLHYSIIGWYVWQSWWGGSFSWDGLVPSLFRAWPVLLSAVSLCSGLAWALYLRTPSRTK
jgi:hypothetical protein